MKTIISFLIILLLGTGVALACPVCEKNQPEVLKGITHGTGPQSSWDYVIIGAAALVVLYTLICTIKFLVRPGEQSCDHIKRTVIN